MYYLLMPFALLLTFFCKILNSYGLALILFALVVKLLLFPVSLKGKRSMIQMNLLNGQLRKLQKQYGSDKQRYQMEVQKLYEKEGVNPMGGCLWSLVPLFVLIPLYAILRQPLKYMMGLSGEQIANVAEALKQGWAATAAKNGWAAEFVNAGYNQLYLSSLLQDPDMLAAAARELGEGAKTLFSINFSFLGVDMSMIPQLRFWSGGLMGFGLFMVPVVSAGTSILFSLVTTKTNNMNNPNGEAASASKTMLLISPLMSLWIGFSMPAALSLYWIANNVLGMLQEVVSGRMLKQDYERAAEEAKRRAIEEKEEEKRLRREKAEQRAREAEEARKNRGKKKPADQMTAEQKAASREGMRQYARGRAYDPDRYGGVTPYHDAKAAQSEGEKTD